VTTCQACGKELPGEFPFCAFCGAALEVAQVPAVERERRVVSVLFCDLVSFTAASEQADVEDVQRHLVAYHQTVRERVEAFGGIVEKFVGDAVMAVFGAPVAHEDDAERAVRAGLAILDAAATLSEVRVRVGVNTGEVLVAIGAHPESGESYVVGDAVNTAARLQAAAQPDTVVVGEPTYRATDRVFEYAELEPVTAKGKSEPIAAWQALAAKSRFGTDLMRDLRTPMVGRSLELGALQNALARSRDGGIQLVTIVGEPGVGKSRLVAELFADIDRSDELHVWRQGRCLPYGDGITYWALAEIAKAHLGIYDGDTDAQVGRKLDAFLEAGPDRTWLRAPLGNLVGSTDGSGVDRDTAFAAWRQFVELMPGDAPAIVVVEDLHWADPSLLDFLEYLADWARDAPVLLVGTARPELLTIRPTWTAGLANAATIRLSPLSASETAELITSQLVDSELPWEVQRAVVERSGGNPLYAEEFVRMLRDRGVVDDAGHRVADVELESIPLPDTVQALIAARLDTLAAPLRAVVQDAAVVGKVFWRGAVAELGKKTPGELEQTLHELVRKEMVRPLRRSSVEEDHEFSFTHALVRDVAYQRLPREERLTRHLATAQWLERLAGDSLGDVAEILTYHATAALDLAEAAGDLVSVERVRPLVVRYALRAGEHLRAIDAGRALDLVDLARSQLSDDDPLRGEVLRAWSLNAVAIRTNAEVTQAVEEALAYYRATGPDAVLASVLLDAATTAWQGDRLLEARGYNAEAVSLLEPYGDSFELAEALADAMIHSRGAMPAAEELAIVQRAIAIVDGLGGPEVPGSVDAWLTAHNAHALATITLLGEEVIAEFDTMITVAERERPARAFPFHNNRAIALGYRQGPPAAIKALDESVAAMRARGLETLGWWQLSTSLQFRLMAGELESAADLAAASAENLGRTGLVSAHESRAQLVRANVALGRTESLSPDWVDTALDSGTGPDFRTISAIAALEWLVATGDVERAPAVLDDVVAAGLDNLELLPRLPAYARVAALVGRPDVIQSIADLISDATPLGRAGRLAASGYAHQDDAPESAAVAFASATAAFAELGATHEQVHALLGEALTRSRLPSIENQAHGREALQLAQQLFTQMGAVPAAAQCAAALAP